jgi:2-phospho-L-lactate guanylyltransferase
MQATVSDFDPHTGAGAALTDDGRRVPFDAAAFSASGLRLLRVGQRLRLDSGPDGRVERVRLVTMP